MRRIRRSTLVILMALGSLSACQTTGFSSKQTELLKREGFQLTEAGWELNLSVKLLFATDSDQLTPELQARITNTTRQLLKVGIDHAHLEGHTDNTGSYAYNQKLSLNRASSVAHVMTEAGMDAQRISVKGVGECRPVSANTTAQGRSENRRVTLIVDPGHP